MRVLLLIVLSCSAYMVAEQPRVFLVNHDAMETSAANGTAKQYIRPVSAEQLGDLQRTCPGIIITAVREKADYVIDWTTKTWDQTSWSGHQNEFSVYNSAGDIVGTGQSHRASAAAKDICGMIAKAQKVKEAK